jgi:MFS family permease
MIKKDPYAALRFKEFRFFLSMRFALVFAWSMQFVIIEWEVYSLTKNPLSLGIIGLMEIIPAVSMALFAGHIVDQNEKRSLLMKCLLGFSIISLGLFLVTVPSVVESLSTSSILAIIYALVFCGGLVRAFIGPTVFSLLSLIVPKKNYPNAATWSSSTWQMGSMFGPAIAGVSIGIIGVHWSMCLVFGCTLFALLWLTQISKKPILNPKLANPYFKV